VYCTKLLGGAKWLRIASAVRRKELTFSTPKKSISNWLCFVLFCSHGTRCAGEVAAARDNGVCGVGVAYDSKIAGDVARVTGYYVVLLCRNSAQT
jgi:hypothetical protein